MKHYAAYYLHQDGTKTRIYVESISAYNDGDRILQWNGDEIEIDFEIKFIKEE